MQFRLPEDSVQPVKNMVAVYYLNAIENDKAYGKDWEKLVLELRKLLNNPLIRANLDIDDEVLYSDLTLNVRSEQAGKVYERATNTPANEPLVFKKESRPEKFITPNKPMYRIFEIDDMDEINGFTGFFIVQEKYDGLRIQIHKFDGKVSVYTFNGNDITSKFGDLVKELEKADLADFILDAEGVLYKDNEPLVRSDTLAYINKKVSGDGDLVAHVFDIMHYDGEEVYKEKFEDRLGVLMQNFSSSASEKVTFPNKKNTREADSKEEIARYAEEIMKNPTAEGVVIKDAKSSYVIGKKKNPKWVKWKNFVDLDVIILAARENKNKSYSYTMGIGPVEEGPKTKELNGKKYISVGKAANYSKKLEVGSIIRVKVDDIIGNKEKGFSLGGAKIHEIPEVEAPDKMVTLELLSEGSRKSLGDYKVEALKKSYCVTDGIHGVAILKTQMDMDGLLFHGFEGENLMGKNAWAEMDLWKQKLEEAYGKDNGRFMAYVANLLQKQPILSIDQIERKFREHDEGMYERLFGGLGQDKAKKKMKSRLMEKGEAYGIVPTDPMSGKRFSLDNKVMIKALGKVGSFSMWTTNKGDLALTINHEGQRYTWEVDVANDREIYNLLGEAGKYPARAVKNTTQDMLIDKGKVIMGAQRHGYHEYILKGDEIDSKFHVRYLPVDKGSKEMWLAWTGYETEPTPKSSDKGLVNIYEDRYNS